MSCLLGPDRTAARRQVADRSWGRGASVRSRLGLVNPLSARAFEERWLHAHSLPRNDRFEAGHETGLAMTIAANFGHQCFPLLVRSTRLVTFPRFLQVRE